MSRYLYVNLLLLCSLSGIVSADSGLVAYYPLDGTFQDIVNGLDGTTCALSGCVGGIIGGPLSVPDRFGQADGAFDVGTGPIVIADDPALNPTDQISIALWINVLQWPINGGRRIINKGTGGLTRQYSIIVNSEVIFFSLNGQNQFDPPPPAQPNVPSVSTLGLATGWHHLAAVWDGSTASLFLDGLLVDAVPFAGPLDVGTDCLSIGSKTCSQDPLEQFVGAVDDVRIYDSALSAQQIEGLVIQSSGVVNLTRGDCNGDGVVNLGDGIGMLGGLFLGGSLPCESACDFDDDECVALVDAIQFLTYLFVAGAPPASPFPGCGVDPTPGLSCGVTACP